MLNQPINHFSSTGENHDFSTMALKVLQFCEDAFKEVS